MVSYALVGVRFRDNRGKDCWFAVGETRLGPARARAIT